MPSSSEKQRRFFGAELARSREGKATKTHMSEDKIREFAKSVKPGGRAKSKKGSSRVSALNNMAGL